MAASELRNLKTASTSRTTIIGRVRDAEVKVTCVTDSQLSLTTINIVTR